MKAIVLAMLPLVLAAAPARADEVPSRKAGLWESKSTSQDGTTTARQCIDDQTDRKAQEMSGVKKNCSKSVVTKTADGYETQSTCSIGQITADGKGKITGDFATYMRTETETVLTGVPGVDKPTPRKTVIEAKRIGDCEPGQKPGDIIMSDGKVYHMGQ